MNHARTLQQAKADIVRTRVVAGAATLLEAGSPLTFKEVADRAGVPERTVYRHFPTRTALLAALFDWTNEQIGFTGPRPTSQSELLELLRASFRGFDLHAPVVRQMLSEPDGSRARLADVVDRRRAATKLVANEVPGVDRVSRDRLAAAIQVLTVAATWQSLREYWDQDGSEASETSAFAIELLLEAARARVRQTRGAPRATRNRRPRSKPG